VQHHGVDIGLARIEPGGREFGMVGRVRIDLRLEGEPVTLAVDAAVLPTTVPFRKLPE